MKNLKNIIILFVFPLLFSQCTKLDKTVYGSTDKMLDAKRGEVTIAKASEVNDCIANHIEGIKIVDVREPEEFEAGHIKGAINVPRGLLEFSDQLTNRRDHLYLYSGTDKRAILSAINLRALKFGKVRVIEGGFDQWAANFPQLIEKGSGAPVGAAPAKKASSGGCGG